jgi:DNA-binding PadR family transcriptional regulator
VAPSRLTTTAARHRPSANHLQYSLVPGAEALALLEQLLVRRDLLAAGLLNHAGDFGRGLENGLKFVADLLFLSGYDIKRYFDASVRHFWTADQAAIYRTLSELEADAFVGHERVEQQTRPDRKEYHITPLGVAAFDTWVAQPAPTVARREPLLLKLFFASRMHAHDLAAVLTAELSAVEAELAAFAEIVASIERDRAEFERQAESVDAVAAHARLLVGPLITLTNGVRFGVANREWLKGLLHAHAQGALTADALLADLHRYMDTPSDGR